MSEVQTTITWSLGTLVTLVTLSGLATKFILVPYLREHLVKPMDLVRKQVTENHHSNTRPTVLDRLDDVQNEVMALGRQVGDVGRQVDAATAERRALRRMHDEHRAWSSRWTRLIERELELLRRQQHDTKESDG